MKRNERTIEVLFLKEDESKKEELIDILRDIVIKIVDKKVKQ